MARIDKINAEVQRELSSIIRDMKDARIPVMTSVVAVNVTSDLRYAKVYVSVMGDYKTKKDAITALQNAKGFVRRELGQRMKMRYTPEIVFVEDNSIEHGAYINKLLREVDAGE